MKDSRRALFESWFDRVWNQNDTDAIFEMFPCGTAEGLGAQKMASPEEFAAFHKKLTSLVSNIKITIDKLVDDGEWIAMMCTLTGNSAANRTPVTMTGTVFAKLGSDTIIQAYNHWDFHHLWEQLGLLPNGAFAQFLDGKDVGQL